MSVCWSGSHHGQAQDTHLSVVAHQSLGNCVDGVEDGELSNTGRTCQSIVSCAVSSQVGGRDAIIPAPRIRAEVDSFLNSVFDDPARTSPALLAASLGEGMSMAIVTVESMNKLIRLLGEPPRRLC